MNEGSFLDEGSALQVERFVILCSSTFKGDALRDQELE